MKPERIGIELRSLPAWQAFLELESQSIQRTVEFPSHAAATFFAGTLNDVCEQHTNLPRIVVQPGGSAEQPARMTVTLSASELETEHFALARAIDATLAILTPEAGDPVEDLSSTETE